MNIFDAHCDTIHEVLIREIPLFENNLYIDLKRMSEYCSYTQLFAVWIEDEADAWENFKKKADRFDCEIEKNSDVTEKCLSYADMKKAHESGKIASFLSLEGAYMVEKEEDFDYIFERGVRCATLTWNGSSKLAGGVLGVGGLTSLGKACVEKMQDMGIIVDASHLNEASFWDMKGISKKPFIASHSNSKTLCGHCRNLTDEQFRAICESGGCVGINFSDTFLKDGGGSDIDDILHHIKHFIKLGGEDYVGFGSDFDGVSTLPSGVNGVGNMKDIVKALEMSGFKESTVEKITHLNFERVIKECVRQGENE